MLNDFKAFLFRGNLLDLATAVILGTAFGAVVASLVKDIFTPLLGAIGGQPSFADLTLAVGDGKIRYGAFIDNVISFVIVALIIFMFLKAAANAQNLRARTDAGEDEVAPPTDEAVLLAEIRDLLKAGR